MGMAPAAPAGRESGGGAAGTVIPGADLTHSTGTPGPRRAPPEVAVPKTWGPAAQSAHALLGLHIQIPQHSTFRVLDRDSAREGVSYTHPRFQLKATIQEPLPLQDGKWARKTE